MPDGRRRSKAKRRAVPIIAGLLVLAVLGALGYWLLNKKEGTTGGTATPPSAGPTPGPSFSGLNEVPLGGPGAGSGIAFGQDLLYVATPTGSKSVKLFAYDAKSAQVRWEKTINGADKPREMIAGPEGILVRTSREGSTTAPLVYFKSDGTPGASLTGSDGDTPRLVGNRIVMIPPGSNTLAGFDASSGAQIWNVSWNSNGLRLYAVTSWAEEGRPISLNGWVGQGAPHELRRLVLLDGSRRARAINTDTGAIDDTSEANWGIDDKILGYDGNLYVSAAQPGAPIRAYKLTDLQNPIWTLDTPYPGDRPNWLNVCGKRLICMLSHDGTVEDKFNTPRQSAHLSAIDLDTHKVKWQHALPYLSYVAAVGDKTLVTYTDKTITSELIDAAGNRKSLGEYRAIRADASTAILLTATADTGVTAALQASRVNATTATVQALGQVRAIPNKAIATADFLACLGDTTFRLWRIPPP